MRVPVAEALPSVAEALPSGCGGSAPFCNKQSPLLVQGLRLEFDKNLNSIEMLNCKIVNVDKLQDNLRSKNLIF